MRVILELTLLDASGNMQIAQTIIVPKDFPIPPKGAFIVADKLGVKEVMGHTYDYAKNEIRICVREYQSSIKHLKDL
jgi:hypothetical protein